MIQTQKLDILCPGDWQDSYESRICNEDHDIDGYHVANFHDAFMVVRNFADRQNEKYGSDWLFKVYYLYLNGELVGEFTRNKLTVYLTTEKVFEKDGKMFIRTHYFVDGLKSVEIKLS